MEAILADTLQKFKPITLQEMSSVKLMNRVDTKFVASRHDLVPLLELLMEDYRVQDINNNRLAGYRTLYYDTPDKQMYLDHQNGKSTRRKVRVREYMGNDLYFFEVKNKNNRGRTKKTRRSLPEWDDFQDPELLPFLEKHSRFTFDDIEPHLQNYFNRITLVNNGMSERLTIDMDLRFHNLDTDQEYDLPGIIIVELKQDGHIDSFSRQCLRQLRIHPMGFSKYCIGSALTNPELKRNNFKRRLHIIDKINNQSSKTNN